MGVPTVGVGEEDFTPQLEALMPLLLQVNWTSVAVAAPSIQVSNRKRNGRLRDEELEAWKRRNLKGSCVKCLTDGV